MSWRDATVAELVRGRSGAAGAAGARTRPSRPARRPAAPRAPFGERVLDGTRTVALLAAASLVVLALAVPVITLVPGLAAGSRLLAEERAGHPVRPLRDVVAVVRRTTPATWPISVAVVLGAAAVVLNLLFLAQQPTVLAACLLVVNLVVATIGGWWVAACTRELADDPALPRSALVRRAGARALHLSRWHVAVAVTALLGAGLVLVSPLLAAFFAPGLVLLAGRVADPRPVPALREV